MQPFNSFKPKSYIQNNNYNTVQMEFLVQFSGWQAFESQSHQLAESAKIIEVKENQLRALEESKQNKSAHLVSIFYHYQFLQTNGVSEVDSLKKEHEDLLVLLAEQDNVIANYRRRLTALGEHVTDDEEAQLQFYLFELGLIYCLLNLQIYKVRLVFALNIYNCFNFVPKLLF